MEIEHPGSYLAEHRRRRRKSLQHVASRMGRGGFSKQALSLIERGRMRIPKLRIKGLHKVYGLEVRGSTLVIANKTGLQELLAA
jgi:transcriptional regulator with XRE-family HTH domain